MTFKRSTLFEVLFVLILLGSAILLREKPPVLEVSPRESPKPAPENITDQNLRERTSPISQVRDLSSGNVKRISNKTGPQVKRNPFTPEGSYSDLMIPENPYTLVAIMKGKPSKALLKLFTGEVQAVKEGDTLLDGARVLKIGEKSVIIERLGKRQELKLLHIEVERWQIKK